jgi:transketolase
MIAAGELPEGWDAGIQQMWEPSEKGDASRNSSGKVLNQVAAGIPWMIGGSADLAPSNKSNLTFEGAGDFGPGNYAGRNFHFGIREFAMAAICNGMATCGIRSYCATFFVFCDYLRGALRLSCLMNLPVLYIFSHDSIGVGEDGPTHQPIEHFASLRAIPDFVFIRPNDANETLEAFKFAVASDRPVGLALSRQNCQTLDRTVYASAENLRKGAYTLIGDDNPEFILLASGSEVDIAIDAYNQLKAQGKRGRVVSVPAHRLFLEQSAEYRESVLPKSVKNRVAIEAACEMSWEKLIGDEGKFIGMHSFGASAPAGLLYKHFGITAEAVVKAVLG